MYNTFAKHVTVSQIGAFHIAFSVIPVLCVFLFASHAVDALFLALCAIVVITWCIFDGECIISYIAKKIENPNYVMGSEPRDLMDMARLFPNAALFSTFIWCNNIAYILAMYIANARTLRIPNRFIMPIVAAFFVSWAAKMDIYAASWLASQ